MIRSGPMSGWQALEGVKAKHLICRVEHGVQSLGPDLGPLVSTRHELEQIKSGAQRTGLPRHKEMGLQHSEYNLNNNCVEVSTLSARDANAMLTFRCLHAIEKTARNAWAVFFFESGADGIGAPPRWAVGQVSFAPEAAAAGLAAA